jgi:hypothetical protein
VGDQGVEPLTGRSTEAQVLVTADGPEVLSG